MRLRISLLPVAALGLVLGTVAAFAQDTPDVLAGEKIFRRCTACHQVGDNAGHVTGPLLNGIVGAKIASREGYKYSAALADLGALGAVWNEAALDAFLENPREYASGTRMFFAGLKSANDRANVIAYLATFSNIGASNKAAFVVSPEVLALKGDTEYGAYLASECTTCHQSSGTNDGIPGIIGLDNTQFVTAMHAYRAKHRKNPVMQLVAGRLGDEEIAALAAYFKDLNP